MNAIKDVHAHWGINGVVCNYALSQATVRSEIDARRPFIMGWLWDAGGGHSLAGLGIMGDNVYYMDPTPGNGFTISTYSWVVNGTGHTWGLSLQITNNSTVDTPSSITVPPNDCDGDYTVSWGASSTSGVTYVLQEATDSSFSTDLRTAYSGSSTSTLITGRSSGNTYYYRVKATLSGYTDSSWRTCSNGCVVTSFLSFVNKNDSTCEGQSPCYTSIQEAINLACPGALIRLAQGTYSESIILNNEKTVELQGGWNPSFTEQTPDTTILNVAPKVQQGTLKLKMLNVKPQ